MATAGRASEVLAGDPQYPGDLPAAIYQAHGSGAKEITIAPGTYDLPSMNHQDTFLFDRWNDTTIHAIGVKLIFEELNHRPVHFHNCANVTWEGGTLLFAHPSFTQGRVIATGSDEKGDFCDWKVDAGYQTDINPGKTTYDVVDQKSRLLKVNTGDWTPGAGEKSGPGLFRLRYPHGRGGGFSMKDWLVTRAPGGSTIIHLDGCKNCTIRNVTLQNGGFAAFFETGGAGGNHYLACRIEPGPQPAGATEEQLVGCGADGFHSVETVTGPDIEDCIFSGVFLDDCIAVHGTFDRVIGGNDNEVTLSSAHPMPRAGDPFRIADMKGFFAQAICEAATQEPDHTVRVTLDRPLRIPIDHSQDSDPRIGTKASDPIYCGRGYKILRCNLGDTRSRGILVKGDDGLIDGCVIRGCGMSGVSIGPEFWWNEAGYCSNVTVSNNKFLACNKCNGEQATVWIHGDGAIENRNMVIKDNSFDTCYGPYIIRSDWADGVRITANGIANPFQVVSPNSRHVIWLTHSRNVKVLDDSVTGWPLSGARGDVVGMDASMNGSIVQNTHGAPQK